MDLHLYTFTYIPSPIYLHIPFLALKNEGWDIRIHVDARPMKAHEGWL